MEIEIATQLITAGATLAGVVLTLLSTAILERRRAHDARALEAERMKLEHAKWLRDERQRAYAALSIAGEEVQQFFRSGLPLLIESDNPQWRDEAEACWHELRSQLRKAYNQVALFGASGVRSVGLSIWRTARNGGNDFFDSLRAVSVTSVDKTGLSEKIRTVASDLGTVGNHFLEACRKDLQGESNGVLRLD